MTVELLLTALLKQRFLEVPRERYALQDLLGTVGEVRGETISTWQLDCAHLPGKPANKDGLTGAEHQLGIELPDQFRRFLTQSNGGKFYVVPLAWLQDEFPGAEHVRYHVFGTSELVEINRDLMSRFRLLLGEDPVYSGLTELNYVAFCDAHNGNFLAILLEGPERGKIFFLDREYFGRPYSELKSDLYYTVAGSLEDWLEMVIRTKGWNGFGAMIPGF